MARGLVVVWSIEEELPPGPPAELRLSRQDRGWVEQRLAALPPVREGDFLDAEHARRGDGDSGSLGEQMAQAGNADVVYDDDDYAEDCAAAARPTF